MAVGGLVRIIILLLSADIMRLAARSLNLNDKEWLKDFQIAELIRCQFCGGMRNPNSQFVQFVKQLINHIRSQKTSSLRYRVIYYYGISNSTNLGEIMMGLESYMGQNLFLGI